MRSCNRFLRCLTWILSLMLLLFALLPLTGCGQTNPGEAPSQTTARPSKETVSIDNAMDIEKGMSFNEVRAILGTDGTKVGFQTNLYAWSLDDGKRLLVWFTQPEGETGHDTRTMTVLDRMIENPS